MVPTPILQKKKKNPNRNSLKVKYNSRMISCNTVRFVATNWKTDNSDKILDSSKKNILWTSRHKDQVTYKRKNQTIWQQFYNKSVE